MYTSLALLTVHFFYKITIIIHQNGANSQFCVYIANIEKLKGDSNQILHM